MKIKLIVSVLIAVFFAAVSGLAQTATQSPATPPSSTVVTLIPPTPQLPMIISSGALRAYALESVREVNASLFSSAFLVGGFDSSAWVGPKESSSIITAVEALRVRAETFNTSELVSFYVDLRNSDGERVMYGYNEAMPVRTGSVWALPESIKVISLRLNPEVSIPLSKPVSRAEIVSRSSVGVINTLPLEVNGAKISYPSNLAGLANAYVRVDWTDGTVSSYQISTGALREGVMLETSARANIPNVTVATNSSSVVVSVPSRNGVVPTIEVNLSTAGNVTFNVSTTEGKRPIAYWFKVVNSRSWTRIAVTSGVTTSFPMVVGTTYVVPEWNPTDFTEAQNPSSPGSSSSPSGG